MRFLLSRALVALAVVSTLAPFATQAGTKTEKSKIASSASVSNFIKDAKDRLALCATEYDKYRALSFASKKGWDVAYEADYSSAKLSGKPFVPPIASKVDPLHQICASSEKEKFIPLAKTFIKSLSAAERQKSAKDMTAQWITAIDSIGNAGAQSEIAKFETLANSLMLDF